MTRTAGDPAAIAAAGVRLAGSVNALEAAIVILSRKGEAGLRELDLLTHNAGIDIVSFSGEHMMLAREAISVSARGGTPRA